MQILAMESYYGGSHRAFLEGLVKHSRHDWTLLTLPARTWKWRMRHSAVTFAEQAAERTKQGRRWDRVFCSDMLNLAEWVALAPPEVGRLPKVLYFHENQLTYPVRVEDERDLQCAMTNLTSALAADAVWFNSEYHRRCFTEALTAFLKRMPDFQLPTAVEAINRKSAVRYPGIEAMSQPTERRPGPLRILWAARWEHDKNPQDFFAALKRLKADGIPFRVRVIGETFRERPPVFTWAKSFFQDHIDHWGYQVAREKYENVLADSDVVVSTADHEFFGITVVEAIAAGCYPLLPNRLSYPEIIGHDQRFLYDGTVDALVRRLGELAERVRRSGLWPEQTDTAELISRFSWTARARQFDDALENTDP